MPTKRTPSTKENKPQLMGKVRVGISGWTYAPWRGEFYPPKLPQHRELAHASSILNSIEINGTFYSLHRPESFAKWADATPEDFVFSVKGPRFITHIRRLEDVKIPVANFLASGLLRLGPKLGPLLWQLPPSFKFDAKRVEAFLKLLPHDTEEAVAVSRRHDKRMSGRSWMKTDKLRPLRHCMEIRHESFRVPEFIEMLRAYDVALVCADTVEWPRLMDLTSDFVYCRLHGAEELYASGYDDRTLDEWAKRIVAWTQGKQAGDADCVIDNPDSRTAPRDVFVYFDNDIKVRAPFDAQTLRTKVDKLTKKSAS
jgi:uncharacterized protein YecE (DUF72 family)